MVYIANSSPFTPEPPEKSAISKFFDKASKKLSINKKSRARKEQRAKEIAEQIAAVDKKTEGETILYTHNSRFDENLSFLDDIMQITGNSNESKQLLTMFHNNGGNFKLDVDLAVDAVYDKSTNDIQIKPQNWFGDIGQGRKDKIAGTIAHEATHAFQVFNGDKHGVKVDFNTHDLLSNIMYFRILEAGACSSQFVAVTEIANNPNKPYPQVLDEFKNIRPHLYSAGMLALGVDETSVRSLPVSEIDLSKIDMNKMDEARSDTFKEWANDENIIYGYGDYIGKHMWIELANNPDHEPLKRADLQNMLDVYAVNPINGKSLFKGKVEDLLDDNFLAIGDKVIETMMTYNDTCHNIDPKGKLQVKKCCAEWEIIKKHIKDKDFNDTLLGKTSLSNNNAINNKFINNKLNTAIR